ncbi:MAG: DNA polymerase III subunit delta [Atopobiaceae bacterium]|nr:DNA polymerase III subunit delta [Atopobiaceae bacterium]
MAQSGLLAAYLVVGVDKLKRDRVIHRLKGRLEPGLEAFNLDERTASADIVPNEFITSLNTLPMGSGFRLVLLHDAGKLPKPVSEAIVTYLQNPNPSSVLCLETEVLAKNTRLYKAVDKVGPKAVITCDAIAARQLPGYVVRVARSIGYNIDSVAAQELVSRVGEDTTLLERTIRSLGEQCGGTIRIEDVEANVSRTAEVKPWEFLDKVAAGDARRALELYRHMPNPSYLALVSLLTRRVRDLICVRSLADRGRQADAAKALGRQEWQVRGLAQSARRYTPAQLIACLKACATCERELKGGSNDEEAAFVKLVLFICNPSA